MRSEGVRAVVSIALVGAGSVAVQRFRYPGGWDYAFSPQYGPERRVLAQARDRFRKLKQDRESRLQEAQEGAFLARSAHEQRLAFGEERLRDLLSPVRGGLVEELGEMALCERALLIGNEEFPLEGLRADYEWSPTGRYRICVMPRGGGTRHISFSRDEYAEGAVRAFAERVTTAGATHAQDLAGRHERSTRVWADLVQTRADTAAVDEAERQVDEVAKANRHDPELADAQSDLEEARHRWYELTGHWPGS
ncbi:hypothetical protein [Streptomyces sp. NBC_00690]|uniref:hypothetical protein n=1 Tax=Streptomyces sp. NBC_00690 TaxID=2975808 RepID=UPI002E2861D2|nr:hypothetical protein [Streptomyces sp. NBC_00690]